MLILDADVVARPRGLTDVRLADEQGRQVPYLVESRAAPMTLGLTVPPRVAREGASVYRLELPFEHYPHGTRLVLTTTSLVFDRRVTLRRGTDNHRNRRATPITTLAWRNADPAHAPLALTFELTATTLRNVELAIDDGDNAPLPLRTAKLLLPGTALRFHHPGAPLFLLYGNGRAQPPRYDLTLLAGQLSREPARVLTMPPAVKGGRGAQGEAPARKMFWVGIAVAAVVLVLMLVRLLSPDATRR